jgi:hypothetical protein
MTYPASLIWLIFQGHWRLIHDALNCNKSRMQIAEHTK